MTLAPAGSGPFYGWIEIQYGVGCLTCIQMCAEETCALSEARCLDAQLLRYSGHDLRRDGGGLPGEGGEQAVLADGVNPARKAAGVAMAIHWISCRAKAERKPLRR